MNHAVDVPSYFARIGYAGDSVARLETLNAIIARHVQAIPFENLDILLNRAISIELPAIEDKLVRAHRGGYCFEHNTLLWHVLRELGFEVSMLSARARYQLPPGVQRPRTHVVLRVQLEGQAFLVDGGFGGLSPTSALLLQPNLEQRTPHEPRRLHAVGAWQGELRGPEAVLVHQVLLGDVWHDLFDLTLEPMPVADRVMANWFTSQHPDSHFRGRLMAARASATGRVTLQDRELTIREPGRSPETRTISSWAELLEALETHFGLTFAAGTRFESPALADLS